MLPGCPRSALRYSRCGANRSRGARQQPNRRERPFRTTPPMQQVAAASYLLASCLVRGLTHAAHPGTRRAVFSNQNMATKDSDQKYGPARKKTTGYHLFRNVLPGCNPILGSPLTAAATQVFSRDVRKRPAYVLCFSTCTIALRQELVPHCGSRSTRCHCAAADPDLPPTWK